jgi:dUTP pyrophosphatase
MLRPLANAEFPGAPAPDLQKQPVGFDLTVGSICRFTGQGCIDLTNEYRSLPTTADIEWRGNEPILLLPGCYLVTYSEEIAVPMDCGGLVLPRSSLLRCGATIHSALWEPGYRGRGQGLLVVHNRIALHPKARIAQYVQISLETAAELSYSGAYQGENLSAELSG